MSFIPGNTGVATKAVDGLEGATSGAPVVFPSGFQGSAVPTTLTDANTTLTITSNPVVVMTPTAIRTITLPSTSIPANYSITVINRSASFQILVNSSGGNLVATVGLGQVTVLSTQSAPTIAGHWSLSTNNGLLQGGNNFGATLTLGTADNFGLNIIANNVSVASATAAGSFTVGPTGSTNQNLTVNGTASTASAHRGGGGMVPVGAITAYNPGYYTATGNVSFTTVGPAGNTVAQVNTFLNASGWYVCDGTAVNNAASPIWNAAGRFLPKLDDSRFLQGSTTAGTVAGVASVTLTSANIPTLTSSGTVTSSGSTVANNTLAQSADHTHSASGLNYPGSAVAGTVGGTDGTHTHGTGYADANAATGGASGLMTFHSSASNNTLGPRTDAGTIIKANNSGHGHGFSLAAAAAGITGSTAGMSASHTHSIPSLSVNSGQTVSATYTNTATSFSILPTYLSTYFIVRVF